MTTELHLTWDDDTIETVLDALSRYPGTFSTHHAAGRLNLEAAEKAGRIAAQAREDIEEAERRTARAGMDPPADDRERVTRKIEFRGTPGELTALRRILAEHGVTTEIPG